ncbi:MAG: hypothetical protein ABIR78_04940 [Ferruginibacter sp.]
MIKLPQGEMELFIRTDFSIISQWQKICEEVTDIENECPPMITIINDPKFSQLKISDLPQFSKDQVTNTFVMLVDEMSSSHPEHPINCVDLTDDFGRYFRVIPSEVCSVSANLGLSNMDFSEFADNVDPDGIFRGFK